MTFTETLVTLATGKSVKITGILVNRLKKFQIKYTEKRLALNQENMGTKYLD